MNKKKNALCEAVVPEPVKLAPGGPGLEPRWTSSAKSAVGAAPGMASRVWFALSHGIFDEIYYPQIDQACIRDWGMIVTNGTDYFSEEKRDTDTTLEWFKPGVPGYRLTNAARDGRYVIRKEVLCDPVRSTVMQWTKFSGSARAGRDGNYRMHVLLAPHLGNRGQGNTGWLGYYERQPMLFAQRKDWSMALACSAPWGAQSVGFVGVSDGWRDLQAHRRLTENYTRAENGNLALVAEIRLPKNGECVFALGFGATPEAAARHARASLRTGFAATKQRFVSAWKTWNRQANPAALADDEDADFLRKSAAVLGVHDSKSPQGGLIASLAVPWGASKGDDDLGGYHLVWPRDLVETAGALVALGAKQEVRCVLEFLQQRQARDGHWAQNMWIDGEPYWDGSQLDETAFPILLVALAREHGVLTSTQAEDYWPMVRRAAAFTVGNGPVTCQDRWEENAGYSPFTLAVAVAALVAAAEMAEENCAPQLAEYWRETADYWNESIERWTYVGDTNLARECGVAGYYVRIAPHEKGEWEPSLFKILKIKNRDRAQMLPAAEVVSPDALALVRFGLRDANDPRIANTVKVLDARLKVATPTGPCWHRYTGDGYGEKANGDPFDGTGIGRAWPLLTGERAHYELARGNRREARRLRRTLRSFANRDGLLPEQIWDAPDIPEKSLHLGRASGSAMPLVWAHAEYLKLCASLARGRIFDLPQAAARRYRGKVPSAARFVWRFDFKCRRMPVGRRLRLETDAAARVRWSRDDWRSHAEAETNDIGAGMHFIDLATERLVAGIVVRFTFFWIDAQQWEGTDFTVEIER